jgi:hypothetical protein
MTTSDDIIKCDKHPLCSYYKFALETYNIRKKSNDNEIDQYTSQIACIQSQLVLVHNLKSDLVDQTNNLTSNFVGFEKLTIEQHDVNP